MANFTEAASPVMGSGDAIDAERSDVKVADAIRALRKTARTAHVPVVVYDAGPRMSSLAKLGPNTFVVRGKSDDAVRAVVDLLEASSRG